jgi:hypothetical protein
MRRHVTADFNIRYTSEQPENKGDGIVSNRTEI